MLQATMSSDAEAFLDAARDGDTDRLTELLAKGIDPNTMINGETALKLAVEESHEEAVGLLLRNGADPDLEGYDI